jgi:hypothetical protein
MLASAAAGAAAMAPGAAAEMQRPMLNLADTMRTALGGR